MDDMIYRQAAIDEIREDADWLESQGSDWQTERKERDFQILAGLPSAQPSFSQPHENDHTAEFSKMDDPISRQAAIDAHCELCGDRGKCNCDICPDVEVFQLLPSTQPERKCLNCGRTANNGGWYADGRTRCPIEEHYALPKDGYCHLWEKRNDTDDDYPERR